jgi:hypothetical protein
MFCHCHCCCVTVTFNTQPSRPIPPHPAVSNPISLILTRHAYFYSHPIPSHPMPSHPMPCHPILSHPIPSHLIASHPISSHPIPFHPIPLLSHPVLSPFLPRTVDFIPNKMDRRGGNNRGAEPEPSAARHTRIVQSTLPALPEPLSLRMSDDEPEVFDFAICWAIACLLLVYYKHNYLNYFKQLLVLSALLLDPHCDSLHIIWRERERSSLSQNTVEHLNTTKKLK